MEWTIVDLRSHTHFEAYTYENEADARNAFNSMARTSVISGWTRTLVLYSDRGQMMANFSLVHNRK